MAIGAQKHIAMRGWRAALRKSFAAAVTLFSLTLVVTGCSGTPAHQAETATSDSNYIIVDSLNTVGQTIGKRAVLEMDKAEMKAMSAKEFSELVDEETAAADSDGADYLTVDFGDGSGIIFPSCTNLFCYCGDLDSEGMMAGHCVSYNRSGNKWTRD